MGHWVDLKESETIGKYFYLARELRKLTNRKMPFVIGTLRIIANSKEKSRGTENYKKCWDQKQHY